MATNRQIESARRNAQNSTGPRTQEGKAASSMNATRFGLYAKSLIIPGEKPSDLRDLISTYFDQYQPVSPLENHLIDTLIHADWNLRRYRRIHAQLLAHLQNDAEEYTDLEHTELGVAFLRDSKISNALTKILRFLNSFERTYNRTLEALREAISNRNPVRSATFPPTPNSQPPNPAVNHHSPAVPQTPPPPDSAPAASDV